VIGNLAGLLVLIALTVFFGWLARRAWRLKRGPVKWARVALFGMPMLLLGLISVFAVMGLLKMYAPRGDPAPDLQVEAMAEPIARGEHLAGAFCAVCHSLNGALPLSGGEDVGKQSPVPVGALIPGNLTPGGPLKDWSDGEIFRAIRAGVDRAGLPLLTMSALSYRHLSDEDIRAVVAYLRSQPTVANDTPPNTPNILFAVFLGAGLVPQPPPVTGVVDAPSKSGSADYGSYIVNYVGCRDCHGANLSGGSGGLTPVGPNLTAIVPNWTRDEFVTTMRTGVDPSGHKLNAVQMPWGAIGKLDDVELAALYEYLHGLTPVQK
jgi:mono/diheme cytochrome c family protein